MGSIILLIGLPATGKYTVARHIAAQLELHGETVRVVDNHYANNVVFNLLPVDGATPLPREAWDRIEDVRRAVLTTIETLSPPDWTFVMTLHATTDEDREWIEGVAAIAANRGNRFAVIRLLCDLEELLRRVGASDRRERMKLTSIDGARTVFREQPVLEVEHPHTMTIDITNLPPGEAAELIVDHISALDPESSAT